MSTHDPLLALGADHRIVIRNGGIARVMDAAEEERESLEYIERLDREMMMIRDLLRRGGRMTPERLEEIRKRI